MEDTTRAGRLRHAADLASGVLDELNVRASTCGGCGLKKYENYGEARSFEELQAVVNKLHKLAASPGMSGAAPVRLAPRKGGRRVSR